MGAIGHSLYGDHRYGEASKGQQLALWSYSLGFVHPVKKEPIACAALPEIATAPWKRFAGTLNTLSCNP
jgi:23S rRNA-/tRNA-specific pseudouridylate synthase